MGETLTMKRILVADHSEIANRMFCAGLSKYGFSVSAVSTTEELIHKCTTEEIDMLLLDLYLEQTSQMDQIHYLRELCPEMYLIVMSDEPDISSAVQTMKNGADDFIEKPCDLDTILKKIRELLKNERELKKETKQPADEILPAADRAVQKIEEVVAKVKDYPTTILITGESGTGKEMFARLIHTSSPRSSKPFVAVNCAAIPESLMESELFGYEEGAFTGARKGGKIGKIQLANHGTFFLDEIGDMPLYLQAKLLRVLNDKKVERIGNSSTSLINVDVRIIAATNQNLEEMIERKEFREDLYYRLNVVPLRLPPLRERPDDIPFLIQHFIKKYDKILGKEIRSASAAVMELMMEYRWPGNVRELENCIEYMMTFEKTQVLSLEVVPQKILSLKSETNLAAVKETDPYEDMPLKARLQEKEREILKEMAARYGGHPTKEQVKEICRILDISVASYYRKISSES